MIFLVLGVLSGVAVGFAYKMGQTKADEARAIQIYDHFQWKCQGSFEDGFVKGKEAGYQMFRAHAITEIDKAFDRGFDAGWNEAVEDME